MNRKSTSSHHAISGEKLLFSISGKQKLLLWFVAVLSVVTSVFTTVMVLSITDAEIEKEYSSILSARIWQVVMLLLGNIFLVVMLWMSGRYVYRISINENGQLTFVIWHMIFIQLKKEFVSTDFNRSIEEHEGKANYPGVPAVHAPWIGVKPMGYKKMIIDLQGNFPEGIDTLMRYISPK